VRFHGVLRCEDGTPVTGGGRIILSRGEQEGFLIALYDEQGAYDQRIPEAVYHVHIWPPGGTALEAHRPTIPLTATAPELAQDLVLAGSRLRGRVLARGPGPLEGTVTVFQPARPEDTMRLARRVVRVEPDGSFVAYGLPPGLHVVEGLIERPTRTWTERAEVVLSPGQTEARLDLEPR
jgi:hypothetical protein